MKKFVTSLIFGVIIALAVASVVSAQEKCHLLVVSGHARIEVSTATKTIMEEVKKEFPEAELLSWIRHTLILRLTFAKNVRGFQVLTLSYCNILFNGTQHLQS